MFTNHLPIMSAYTTNTVQEMNMERLLYMFQQRMRILLKEDAVTDQMYAQLPWVIEIVEDEIMPAVDKIVDWEPSDDEIMENNSCGTPWHDGCM